MEYLAITINVTTHAAILRISLVFKTAHSAKEKVKISLQRKGTEYQLGGTCEIKRRCLFT